MFEEIVEEIVATVVSPPRAGYSRWAMGEVKWKEGLGKGVILTIVMANDRESHRQRAFKGSKEPLFEGKFKNVVRLRLNGRQSDTGH